MERRSNQLAKKSKASIEVPKRDITLRELAEGASKVLQNAEDLFHEATALHAAGAFGRALFLHQISLEECAKIDMLGAWAASVLTGVRLDIQKTSQAFASHKAKNYTNAYMLPVAGDEADARQSKRWPEASKAFKQRQAQFHEESNLAKNSALYVDFQGGNFVAPRERITAAMVEDFAERNEKYLGSAYSKTRMMNRWVTSPERVREMLTWFEARIREIESTSDDPEGALSIIVDEMLSKAKETGYADAVIKREEKRTD